MVQTPHICTLHHAGRHDGLDFPAMEHTGRDARGATQKTTASTSFITAFVGVHIRAKDRIDPSLVSLPASAEPLEHLGVKTNRYGLLWPWQDDSSCFPKLFIRGMSVRIRLDRVTDLFLRQRAGLIPISLRVRNSRSTFLLMLFGLPCRDDPPEWLIENRINHRDRPTINESNRIPSLLRIIETRVQSLKRRTVKNLDRILEGNPMQPTIPYGLDLIPSVTYRSHLHNVFTLQTRN